MPIRAELKPLYPPDWPAISHRIRFERAKGRCESCGRPHGHLVPQRADGTWMSPDGRWYDDCGRPAWAGDLLASAEARPKKVVLAAAHLDHDPSNSEDGNLAALCGRCHLAHDREEHLRRKRIYRRARLAVADLFEGDYFPIALEDPSITAMREALAEIQRYAAARRRRRSANSPAVVA